MAATWAGVAHDAAQWSVSISSRAVAIVVNRDQARRALVAERGAAREVPDREVFGRLQRARRRRKAVCEQPTLLSHSACKALFRAAAGRGHRPRCARTPTARTKGHPGRDGPANVRDHHTAGPIAESRFPRPLRAWLTVDPRVLLVPRIATAQGSCSYRPRAGGRPSPCEPNVGDGRGGWRRW